MRCTINIYKDYNDQWEAPFTFHYKSNYSPKKGDFIEKFNLAKGDSQVVRVSYNPQFDMLEVDSCIKTYETEH